MDEKNMSYKSRNAYIEYVGAQMADKLELVDSDLSRIGEFTRGNLSMWLRCRNGDLAWGLYATPIQDFHAVCDDIDIPWETEEARLIYKKVYPYR